MRSTERFELEAELNTLIYTSQRYESCERIGRKSVKKFSSQWKDRRETKVDECSRT